jgi:hypothetical protein
MNVYEYTMKTSTLRLFDLYSFIHFTRLPLTYKTFLNTTAIWYLFQFYFAGAVFLERELLYLMPISDGLHCGLEKKSSETSLVENASRSIVVVQFQHGLRLVEYFEETGKFEPSSSPDTIA